MSAQVPPAVDVHCHTMLSDGELIAAELIRRVEVAGLSGLALTDHADASNLDSIVTAMRLASDAENEFGVLRCVPGCELTHCRPKQMASLVERARKLGAGLVLIHGESPVEPVAPESNRAAIEAGCDLLAHPGYITEQDAALAAERGVLLEISGKPGHSLANGHVVRMAQATGAQVVYGGDSHRPGDIRSPRGVYDVLTLAGLSDAEARAAIDRARALLDRVNPRSA